MYPTLFQTQSLWLGHIPWRHMSLHGIRAHGRSTMMVIVCGQFPHDSNLTIEIILRMFEQLQVHV